MRMRNFFFFFVREYRYEFFDFVGFFLFWRSSKSMMMIRVECSREHERTSTRGTTIGRRDEKSCRWVQIDDVNGPPASKGGWLVEK